MNKNNPVDEFIANATQASLGEKTRSLNHPSVELEERINLSNTSEKTSSLEERIQRLEELFDQLLINLQGKGTTFNIALSNKQDAPISNNITTDISFSQQFESELSDVFALVMDSKNADAIQQYESFKEELEESSPKAGTLKGLWNVLCQAVPAIKGALDIGKVLALLA